MNITVASIIKYMVPGFPDEEIEKLASRTVFRTVPKGGHFLRAGQTPKKFCFMTKGMARYYYLSDDGKEFTKAFFTDGSILSSYSAMIHDTPSHYSIQALVPMEIYEVSYAAWQELVASNPVWNLFLIAMLEKGYGIKEKREREFLLLDAEARYRIFQSEVGEMESDIRQHLIASYLGITPVALSRIRRKIKP